MGDIVEHHLEHEQRGRDAEADDIGEGIELAAEGTFPAAEARKPSVEQIEDAGGEDAIDADEVGVLPAFHARVALEGGVDDLEHGKEAEDEVARRHQVRQEINFAGIGWSVVRGRAHGFNETVT